MKKRALVAIIAALIAVSSLAGCGCENKSENHTATPDEAVTTTAATTEHTEPTTKLLDSTEQAIANQGLKVNDKGEVVDANGKKLETTADGKVKVKTEDGKTVEVSTDKIKTIQDRTTDNKTAVDSGNTKQQTSTVSTQKSESSKTSSVQTSKSNESHSNKTWHEAVYKTVEHPAETKQVKVVDKEAYTYEEPVYELKKIHKCKDCGMDLLTLATQAERTAHSKNHVLNEGGDGGWYTAQEEVQVGTRTVTVPEEYHMETVVTKEAWTEKVLVKEAGWY